MLYCEPLETKKVSGTFFVFHQEKTTSEREEVPDTFLLLRQFLLPSGDKVRMRGDTLALSLERVSKNT